GSLQDCHHNSLRLLWQPCGHVASGADLQQRPSVGCKHGSCRSTSLWWRKSGCLWLTAAVSCIIWPVECIPYPLRYLSLALPQTYASESLRCIMYRDESFLGCMFGINV
ncbi:hypothetical protein XENOCAPTIV_013795, partial [Xenoophorus captivus]